jgi:hypothetical protein
MASGAAMALEDASCCRAALLTTTSRLSEAALAAYEAIRKPRASSVQAGSSANTWMRQETNPDWLYGYDAWRVPLALRERGYCLHLLGSLMSPAEYIAALDRASTRCTTPLGSGHMVWRRWGPGRAARAAAWRHRELDALDPQRRVALATDDGRDSGPPRLGRLRKPQPPFSAESIAAMLLQGLDEIIGAQTQFSIGGFSMGGTDRGLSRAAGESRVDALVLVGSTGMGGTRAQMEPLKSWRRLPTDEEKRAIHRMNLGILMIHDPQNIDALAVEVQSRNAAVSRIRGKHVSHTGSLANCLPGFTGRLAGIWGEHDPTAAPYLAERRERLQSFQPGAPFDIVPGAGHWVAV